MAETAAKQVKASENVPAKTAHRTGLPALIDRELEGFFDALFEDDHRGFRRWPSLLRRRWAGLGEAPQIASLDVYETGDEVVIKAEMPGMAREDIDISVTDSTLTVKGEKTREEKVEKENYSRSERSFGMISRTVELPCEVKAEQVTAKLTDGVLEVHAPKTEEAKKHKAIKVKVA